MPSCHGGIGGRQLFAPVLCCGMTSSRDIVRHGAGGPHPLAILLELFHDCRDRCRALAKAPWETGLAPPPLAGGGRVFLRQHRWGGVLFLEDSSTGSPR